MTVHTNVIGFVQNISERIINCRYQNLQLELRFPSKRVTFFRNLTTTSDVQVGWYTTLKYTTYSAMVTYSINCNSRFVLSRPLDHSFLSCAILYYVYKMHSQVNVDVWVRIHNLRMKITAEKCQKRKFYAGMVHLLGKDLLEAAI